MKKVILLILTTFVILSTIQCTPDVQNDEQGKILSKFLSQIEKLYEPISKDTARKMIILDYFKLYNANVLGNQVLTDSINFDYPENSFYVDSKILVDYVNTIIKATDSTGYLVVKFALYESRLPEGGKKAILYNNFSMYFTGITRNNISLDSLIPPLQINGSYAKSSPKDTSNFSKISKLLYKNRITGFSNLGNNGIAYEIKKAIDYILKHPSIKTFYIYPAASDIDISDDLFTTVIFSNIPNLRTNLSAQVNVSDTFADRGQSCCPPGQK